MKSLPVPEIGISETDYARTNTVKVVVWVQMPSGERCEFHEIVVGPRDDDWTLALGVARGNVLQTALLFYVEYAAVELEGNILEKSRAVVAFWKLHFDRLLESLRPKTTRLLFQKSA